MTTPQRLGIAIPARNAAATIDRTLSMLRSATDLDLDIVVVDGHSTDDTRRIAEERGIGVLSRQPRGIYDAVNAGIRALAAEWVTYINADDLLYPDAIAGMLQAAGRHDVLYGPVDFIDAEGRFMHCWHSAAPAALLPLYRGGYSPLLQQGTLFRRAVFDRLGGFDERWSLVADSDFWFRALEAGFRFRRSTHPPVAAFRMHASQASRVHAAESRREHAAMGAAHGVRRSAWSVGLSCGWRAGNWRSYLSRLLRGRDLRGGVGSLSAYALPPSP